MKIQFKLDDKLYSGSAEPVERLGSIQYQVELKKEGSKPVNFTS